MSKLHMVDYLDAVEQHGIEGYRLLVEEGYHPSVVGAKAMKAAGKGYTDYGVSPRGAWITEKGKRFLGKWNK